MTLNHRNKLSNKISKLFRSKSEQALKCSPQHSPNGSPKNSPKTAPKRRLLRVVRDNEQEGEEWENPHLVRRYTKQYWEAQMEEARALQHSVSLPYDVNTDRTILKKATSTDLDKATYTDIDKATSTDIDTDVSNDLPSPLLANKRASFKEEVQVIEFCGRERIAKRACYMHAAKLTDSENEVFESDCEQRDSDMFKTCEKKERRHEFKLAKQDSFDEEDEDDYVNVCSDPICREDSDISAPDIISDSGAMSDTSGCYSDTEAPKKKLKKKKLHLRVKLLDTSNDSDKENEQLSSQTKPKFYSKTISKLLKTVHLERDREVNSSSCETDSSVKYKGH